MKVTGRSLRTPARVGLGHATMGTCFLKVTGKVTEGGSNTTTIGTATTAIETLDKTEMNVVIAINSWLVRKVQPSHLRASVKMSAVGVR
jgi:hypothetical protein